jgi:hypothetical protein
MTISQDILDDTTTISGMFNTNILQGSPLSTLNNSVVSTNTALKSLDEVQKNGIARQSDINNIISDESTRLKAKKATIDQAILSQNRIIYFNDNSRKIYSAYLMILVILTITLAIVWVIRVIKKHVEAIPNWIFDILIIIVISVGLIIIYNYWVNIQIRNRYNFDEINLDPPKIKTDDDQNKNDLTVGAFGVCIGSDCCKPATKSEPGSTWDNEKGKCINDPIVTTSTETPTVTTSTATQGFHTMDAVKPTDAFEYSNYSPYK